MNNKGVFKMFTYRKSFLERMKSLWSSIKKLEEKIKERENYFPTYKKKLLRDRRYSEIALNTLLNDYQNTTKSLLEEYKNLLRTYKTVPYIMQSLSRKYKESYTPLLSYKKYVTPKIYANEYYELDTPHIKGRYSLAELNEMFNIMTVNHLGALIHNHNTLYGINHYSDIISRIYKQCFNINYKHKIMHRRDAGKRSREIAMCEGVLKSILEAMSGYKLNIIFYKFNSETNFISKYMVQEDKGNYLIWDANTYNGFPCDTYRD